MRIFLPIEIKVREFDAKLLFALFAAERGWECVLGGQMELIERMPRFDPGLYIDKSTAISKREWFKRCRALGHHLAAWDEEGLIYLNDEIYHATRMDPEAFGLTDLFFAWGDHQTRTALSAYGDAADRIRPVGNPRMDLLRPEFRGFCDDRVDALRRAHGRMLLINANFALANYARGQEAAERVFDPYPLGRRRDLVAGWRNFQEAGLRGFMEAAETLHEHFPDHTIVIRPSPSESADPWRQRFEGRARFVVSKIGNVVEWIRAADAVVHWNCTTAVEAYLLGIPAVAYRCATSEVYETPLAIACSREAFTPDDLCEHVHRAVERNAEAEALVRARAEPLLRQHLASFEGPTSCERILDAIAAHDWPPRRRLPPDVPWIKRAWRAWLRLVRRPDPADVRYYREKFPGLTVEEARAATAAFARVTGRFGRVRIAPVVRNVIQVRPS